MPRSFMLPGDSQRPREFRAALLAVAAHAIVLAVLASWTTRRLVPEAPRATPPTIQPERIYFSRTPMVAPVGEAPRRGIRAPASTPTVPLASVTADSSASHSLSARDESLEAVPRSPALLDQIFAPPPRDPRLMVPSGATGHSSAAALDALRDSLEALRSAALQPSGWLLKIDGAHYGVSPGALRFGQVIVPLPSFISFRDVNPQKRAERSMLKDIAEQAERQLRDSLHAARRRP